MERNVPKNLYLIPYAHLFLQTGTQEAICPQGGHGVPPLRRKENPLENTPGVTFVQLPWGGYIMFGTGMQGRAGAGPVPGTA